MLLNGDHFAPLFDQIKKVQETLGAYCLAPDKVPVSLDDLQYAVEQEFGVKVTWRLVPLEGELLRGMIERREGSSTIYLDAGLSKTWTRYVAAKELAHHLVDNDEYRADDPTEIIEFIVHDTPTNPHNEHAPPHIATEDLTRFAAMELLFPFSLRKATKARIERGEESLFTASEWLEIPEHLVELALGDWYMEFAEGVWQQVNGAALAAE